MRKLQACTFEQDRSHFGAIGNQSSAKEKILEYRNYLHQWIHFQHRLLLGTDKRLPLSGAGTETIEIKVFKVSD
jgi:hypothetical protein